MGLFDSPEDLRLKGLSLADGSDPICEGRPNHKEAIIMFNKAISKGNLTALYDCAVSKKNISDFDGAVIDLIRLSEAPECSDGLKNKSYILLANIYENTFDDKEVALKYYDLSANMGDASSMEAAVRISISFSEYEKALFYAKNYLDSTTASNTKKYNIFKEILRLFTKDEDMSSYNATGIYTWRGWYEHALNLDILKDTDKIDFYYNLGRNVIVESVERNPAPGVTYVEHYAKNINFHLAYDCFSKAYKLGDFCSKYYLAILEYYKQNPSYKTLNDLFGEEFIHTYLSDSKNVRTPSLRFPINILLTDMIQNLKRRWSIVYSLYEGENVYNNEIKSIVGCSDFTNLVNVLYSECITELKKHWNFSSFAPYIPRKIYTEQKILLFNGIKNSYKRSAAKSLCKLINALLDLGGDNVCRFIELSYEDVLSHHGTAAKINYIRSVIRKEGSSDGNVKNTNQLIYFNEPYRISDNNNPDTAQDYNLITRVITDHVLNHQADGSTCYFIMGGELQELLPALRNNNLEPFQYKVLNFDGYSGKEAVQLLENLLDKDRTVFIDELKDLISKKVDLKNRYRSDGLRGVNYSTIQALGSVVRHYSRNYGTAYNHDGISVAVSRIEEILDIADKSETDLNEALKELNDLVGLRNIKEKAHGIINTVKINQLKRQKGIAVRENSLHMVFTGNPGTGKTTVAKLMGEILKGLDVLSKGHVVNVTRADLVADYVGQTATKTRRILKSALGGVLFIDEAYSLTNDNRSSSKDFGLEAIEEILRFMSEHSSEFVVIVAGYDNDMAEFLNSNPGLRSRFTTTVRFDDFTADELYQVFARLCKKDGYTIESKVESRVKADFVAEQNTNRGPNSHFANARFVENYYRDLIIKHNNYLVNHCDNDIGSLTVKQLTTISYDVFTDLN